MSTRGFIFDIKKYSINDGPGIRTTIFFKGCPLKCWWCHNPESQNKLPEEFEGCTFRWNLSHDPNQKNIIGTEVFSDDVMKEIEKDVPFYEESKGGVTFSGGEPMMQMDFLFELLTKSKKKDIHTAVDTTGFTDYQNFERIYELTDLFLYDLKLIDNEQHFLYTGVPNKIIHENLKRLSERGNKIILRIPVIPTITDTTGNLDSMINFISELKSVREIDLLPFHKTAESKYQKMGKENKVLQLEPPTDEQMNNIKYRFSSLGHTVKIGG